MSLLFVKSIYIKIFLFVWVNLINSIAHLCLGRNQKIMIGTSNNTNVFKFKILHDFSKQRLPPSDSG